MIKFYWLGNWLTCIRGLTFYALMQISQAAGKAWVYIMSTFKENVYQKYGFIYQIGEEYYAMGANIFCRVADPAEIDNLDLLQNAVKKNNERQIAKYLDKIIRIANAYRVGATEHYKLQEKLFQFIDELEKENEQAYQQLQKQVFQFDELFQKYSRHSNPEEENKA